MAFLNSSDVSRMRQPAGESPTAESKPDPAADAQALINKIQQLESAGKERDTKFHRMLEENSRQQEILRTQLAQRVEPARPKVEAPATTTNWLDLLGAQPPTETKEPKMADTSSFNPADIERMVEAKLAERDRKAQEAAMAQQQQVEKLRERFKTEHQDILEDPTRSEFARQTMNEIQQINPALPYDQVYEMAIAKTRNAEALFRPAAPKGGSRMQQTQQPVSSPYGISNFSQPQAPAARRNSDPFEGRVETGDRADIEAARRQEIQEIRAAHLKKFGR